MKAIDRLKAQPMFIKVGVLIFVIVIAAAIASNFSDDEPVGEPTKYAEDYVAEECGWNRSWISESGTERQDLRTGRWYRTFNLRDDTNLTPFPRQAYIWDDGTITCP